MVKVKVEDHMWQENNVNLVKIIVKEVYVVTKSDF
jgi:hypothetical protein